ncbi:hypothetical protein RBH26_05490 [Natronolimnohabitans sp. A-GB9]|uniref:hypothetical protein n=1 Tax=Natronolimnohabitans sp. A-GB9 TaxID=3069757 RepID=UPI0027B282C3|nr:hypothetical protein [Natronolimnohabitans sp. A-GB9]MDQ2049932.1 hypothetical protein [Natronolimnohabitans sp. A-GB9]
MSPPPVSVAGAVLAALASPPAKTSPAALSGVGPIPSQALDIAVGVTVLAVVVGTVAVAGAPNAVRSISDEIAGRPGRSFAAGFLGFFGLLVVVASPLTAASLLEWPALTSIAGPVSIPGLLLWAGLLLVGSCLGAVAVGDRLARRIGGDSTPLVAGVAVGAIVLGGSQLVPVLGALVPMGLATVAIGAILRRRVGVDEWLFDVDSSQPPEREHSSDDESHPSEPNTPTADERRDATVGPAESDWEWGLDETTSRDDDDEREADRRR